MTAIGTRKLTVEIDDVEYTSEVSVCEITSAATSSDFVPFSAAAAGGGRDYGLHIVAAQDAASASFWSLVWSQAGADVPFTITPYGNATASATEPHFEGIATVTEPDGVLLGGTANASNTSRFTIDVTWPCLAKPTRVTV